jgi:hypothetical protein
MKTLIERRMALPVKPPLRWYLMLFLEERLYTIISSSSLQFCRSTDHSSLKENQNVILKNGSAAKIVKIASVEEHLKVYQRRLERKLDCCSSINDTDSFAFLNNTINSEFETQKEFCAPKEVNKDVDANIEGPFEVTDLDVESEETQSTNSILLNILKEQQKTNELLQQSISYQREHSKHLKKLHKKCLSDSTKPVADVEVSLLPKVMYENVNLTAIGSRSLDPSNYGLVLARQLWTDEELKGGMLAKKRSSSGRPPLSPNRSLLFNEAIKARFGFEENDCLTDAQRAVNQLGNDLRSGKRQRYADK